MSPGVNHFETMYSPRPFVPSAGMVSPNKNDGNHGLPSPAAERLADGKALRELMGHIARNPQLVDELACRQSREARIELLIHANLLASKQDLPAWGEGKTARRGLSAHAQKGEKLQDARVAWSIIGFGGSYEG